MRSRQWFDRYTEYTPQLTAIIADVCAKHGLQWREMVSQRRERRLIAARFEAYWRCINETAASYPHVAQLFERDHTTIIYGARVHARQLAATKSQEAAHAAP